MLARSYERAKAILDSFEHKRVFAVGDVMLDESYHGTVSPNPESGAPKFKVNHKSRKANTGGAGNVARNAAALDANVDLLAVIGSNPPGWEILKLAELEGYRPHIIEIPGNNWITTRKTRYIDQWNHHVLRVDEDPEEPLPDDIEKRLISYCAEYIKEAEAVIVSDYRKGVVTPKLAEVLKKLVRKRGIPMLVDVKPQNAPLFMGVDMFSPNQEEARAFLGRPDGKEPLEEVAQEVSKKFATTLFLTAAEQGIYVSSHGGKALLIPQRHRIEVADTSGCGDTAAVVILLSMLCSARVDEAAELANAAGAEVASHIGAVAPTRDEVLTRLTRED